MLKDHHVALQVRRPGRRRHPVRARRGGRQGRAPRGPPDQGAGPAAVQGLGRQERGPAELQDRRLLPTPLPPRQEVLAAHGPADAAQVHQHAPDLLAPHLRPGPQHPVCRRPHQQRVPVCVAHPRLARPESHHRHRQQDGPLPLYQRGHGQGALDHVRDAAGRRGEPGHGLHALRRPGESVARLRHPVVALRVRALPALGRAIATDAPQGGALPQPARPAQVRVRLLPQPLQPEDPQSVSDPPQPGRPAQAPRPEVPAPRVRWRHAHGRDDRAVEGGDRRQAEERHEAGRHAAAEHPRHRYEEHGGPRQPRSLLHRHLHRHGLLQEARSRLAADRRAQ